MLPTSPMMVCVDSMCFMHVPHLHAVWYPPESYIAAPVIYTYHVHWEYANVSAAYLVLECVHERSLTSYSSPYHLHSRALLVCAAASLE